MEYLLDSVRGHRVRRCIYALPLMRNGELGKFDFGKAKSLSYGRILEALSYMVLNITGFAICRHGLINHLNSQSQY